MNPSESVFRNALAQMRREPSQEPPSFQDLVSEYIRGVKEGNGAGYGSSGASLYVPKRSRRPGVEL